MQPKTTEKEKTSPKAKYTSPTLKAHGALNDHTRTSNPNLAANDGTAGCS